MKNFFIILIGVILSSVSFSVYATIAKPGPIEFTQPDGTKITILLKGDENVKWAETIDGYSIMFNSGGFYEYAHLNTDNELTLSGIIAKNLDERSASEVEYLSNIEKHLLYSGSQLNILKSAHKIFHSEAQKSFPTTGSRKLVCILMSYSDVSFQKTQAEFNNLFNQVNYLAEGADGSVKDFYEEDSYNQLNLTVTVAGPYTAANNLNYYGANDGSGNDVRPRELVTEAVNLADADVNYADFDNDGDGTVDGVYVIYAGYGEEAGAPANTIWAHAWTIPTVTLDGKTIEKYSCSPELRSNSGTGISRIGVICHEFGHVLGAKDFYDTDYGTGGQYAGNAHWDMMSSGNWNNDGITPAHHNPYTRTTTYGWASVTTLSAPAHITLYNSAEYSNSFYRYNTTTANEYFLIENRQLLKFDASIPGHGMLIYHVDGDFVTSHWSSNDINAGSHQGFYPVCATAAGNPTAVYGNIDTDECPFPGTGSRTAFTDATTPYAKSWAVANTDKPVTGITENIGDNTVSFYFMAAVFAGTVDCSFSNPLNWSGGSVPAANMNIVIAAGKNMCVDANYTCNTLQFEAGSSFSCTDPSILTISGDVLNKDGNVRLDIVSSLQVRSSIEIQN
jgi:M6 family metalloprotease-like protein